MSGFDAIVGFNPLAGLDPIVKFYILSNFSSSCCVYTRSSSHCPSLLISLCLVSKYEALGLKILLWLYGRNVVF